ncbi:nucleotidyl transferase AbiEii/AbiGii toxin family protein [Candidatus Fermentibacteria bacterium]|nr:nucleotidyl transferase AbiEii/AbiGii toxin family protein [Candidatus Fermentibacteria bacterium]
MHASSVEAIADALSRANVRYLVVGGLAVVAHGHLRFTADIDIVLDLKRSNVEAAMTALAALGYRPRAPVALAEFADPAMRASWAREKGLRVFSLWSALYPATEIDIFVEEPFDFTETYRRADLVEILPSLTLPVVAIDDLLALKRAAGRPVDLEDVRALDALRRDRGED